MDRQYIGSHGATDLGSEADDIMSMISRTDRRSEVKMHPWVSPFSTHLEVMDFTVSQRLKSLQKRNDNSNAQYREDRPQASFTRRRMGQTPENDKMSIPKRSRRNKISCADAYASVDDVVDIRQNGATCAIENGQQNLGVSRGFESALSPTLASSNQHGGYGGGTKR